MQAVRCTCAADCCWPVQVQPHLSLNVVNNVELDGRRSALQVTNNIRQSFPSAMRVFGGACQELVAHGAACDR
jgi:hypothetical protein